MRISDWSSDVCSSDLHQNFFSICSQIVRGVVRKSHCGTPKFGPETGLLTFPMLSTNTVADHPCGASTATLVRAMNRLSPGVTHVPLAMVTGDRLAVYVQATENGNRTGVEDGQGWRERV